MEKRNKYIFNCSEDFDKINKVTIYNISNYLWPTSTCGFTMRCFWLFRGIFSLPRVICCHRDPDLIYILCAPLNFFRSMWKIELKGRKLAVKLSCKLIGTACSTHPLPRLRIFMIFEKLVFFLCFFFCLTRVFLWVCSPFKIYATCLL